MKIGNLQFKNYAAKKPVTVSPTGEFLTAKDVASEASLSLGSLASLKTDQQLQLVLERYRLEPDFKLALVGVGLMTKKEIMEQIKSQTAFGKTAVHAEIAYCTELMSALRARTVPKMPPMPERPGPKVPDWKHVKKTIWVKMKTRAVFCENTTDPVTGPMAVYRIHNVHPVFTSRGFKVVPLTGTNDTRTYFEPEAKNKLTVYLSGVGHGAEATYTGNNNSAILDVGHYDPAEVAGKAIHFLSCQTAVKLGPDTIAKGAKCYAGYDRNFTFVWDDKTTKVNEFQLFAMADSTFDIWMACSKTAKQAYDATIQVYNACMALVPNTVAATWLAFDRDHFKLLGAVGTVIMPYRWVKIFLPLKTMADENALVQAGELVD